MGLVIGDEVRFARRRNLTGLFRRDDDIFGHASLIDEVVEHPGETGRRRQAGCCRLHQLRACDILARGTHKARFAEGIVLQGAREKRGIEGPIRAAEIRVAPDLGRNALLRGGESQTVDHFVQSGAADHLIEHVLVEPYGLCLLHGELALGLGGNRADLAAQLLVIFGVGNLGGADVGNHSIRSAAEDVRNPPESESEHEDADNDRRDPGFGGGTELLQHGRTKWPRRAADDRERSETRQGFLKM